ncbi:MAG: hypothetical protein NTW16_16130 [Bacteroidetes bacterium]|nr:hypothetical protein [Bacteroidota bacterium]
MKTGFRTLFLFTAISAFVLSGCNKEGPVGPVGPAGQNATVYYSEWFSPTAWSGSSGNWYFAATAPDLTEGIVESGVVLAYAWLADDVYEGTSVRPLPAYAVGANWSFLIHQYGSIEFTSDMFAPPLTNGNKFRFIAIPGPITALKSGTPRSRCPEVRLNREADYRLTRIFLITLLLPFSRITE